MDKFFPAFFVLLLLAFAAYTGLTAYLAENELPHEAAQREAVENGEGRYYYDDRGFRYFEWHTNAAR
jgi:hypothetical protein